MDKRQRRHGDSVNMNSGRVIISWSKIESGEHNTVTAENEKSSGKKKGATNLRINMLPR